MKQDSEEAALPLQEDKDQLMMMTITRSSPEKSQPSWTLYENPFFISPSDSHHHPHHHHNRHNTTKSHSSSSHHFNLSNDPRKNIPASFLDLTLLKAFMDCELELLRTQIKDMKADVEHERKARKRAEYLNKKLAKELVEERRGRDALERVCEKLAREVSSDKADIERMKREMEEERKMLRLAEVLREERVQMKLAEAKVLLEEKIRELEMRAVAVAQTVCTAERIMSSDNDKRGPLNDAEDGRKVERLFFGKDDESMKRPVLREKSTISGENSVKNVLEHRADRESSSAVPLTGEGSSFGGGFWIKDPKKAILSAMNKACNYDNDHRNDKEEAAPSAVVHRKPSPEPENPHIKRGIKGFVEFPRVVRAMGSKSSRQYWGTKLECQKAQIRILLRQKSAPGGSRSTSLIWS